MKYNYNKLEEYLESQKNGEIKIEYEKLEKLLENELPKSAFKHRAYFSNSKSHPISKVWLESNWKQIELILGEYLVLKKLNSF